MAEKDPAAVALGKKRWRKVSAAELRAHMRLVRRGGPIETERKPKAPSK